MQHRADRQVMFSPFSIAPSLYLFLSPSLSIPGIGRLEQMG